MVADGAGSGAAVERLRGAGLRVTAARLAVLEVLVGVNLHLDADGVATAVRPRLGTVSTQAVYDNLRTLTDAGLLRRIELPGSPAHYETRVGDNHHHVICRRCGTTCDVDCVVGVAPCLEPSATHGFLIEEAQVTFWGLCPTCHGRDSGIGCDSGNEHRADALTGITQTR